MAKQFNILATSDDLRILQRALATHGDVDFLSDVVTEDLRDLLPLETLEVPSHRMGKDSLFCYLAPRNLPRRVVVERDSPVKVHVDLVESHLIELWRPYYDSHTMREGRVYYQNRVSRDGDGVPKDRSFCGWADSVLSRIRKTFQLDKALGAYVGSIAAEAIASKRLIVVA